MIRAGMRPLAILLAGLVALGGCGNDPDANPGVKIVKGLGTTLAQRAKGGAAPAGGGAITREQLAQFNTPMQMAIVPALGLTTYFVPFGQNGGVETWASTDNKTVSFRQGIMVASRGFGPDIMQAVAPSAGQIAAGAGSHQRIYEYLDGSDQILRREFVCTLSNHGSETITVVGRQHPTRHVSETCTANGTSFTNEYWFEGGNFLRKSKQLLVPEWGHVEFQRVVDKG